MNLYGNSNDTNFCSVQLPATQPMAPSTATCVQRLFIVCSPHVLPLHVLKKVFCRFGHLIDVYLLNNRNCGYVKYAKIESARQVIEYPISYTSKKLQFFVFLWLVYRSIENSTIIF